MDEVTALRELEDDVPALTGDARAAARTRLSEAIAKEGRRRAGVLPRRLVLRAGFTTAAAAVAGTVVVAGGGKGGGTGGTMLTAAQVLHRAADRTRADGAGTPVPRDDQYLYAREDYTRTRRKGGKRTTHTDEFWISVDGSRLSRYVYDGRIKDEPPSAHSVQWPPNEYAKLAKLPTDPDKLLEAFGGGSDGLVVRSDGKVADADEVEESTARMAYAQLCLLLRGPRVMPPGLRAAAFEALALLPGIVLDDDEVDALGRHGIGVSYPTVSFGLVFERRTYAYLGMRQEGLGAKGEVTYTEVKGLVVSGVVDEIGQRPR
ncbi:CU044_5270 family protein [Streptomyces sp. NBC_01185]|uniref:CU044_5270 family protein n=1 Tax=Streptomyces sp. NBC_01185 TaxID=2903764 RepID=UPI00386CCB0F|nr:CU044_5270 family protein [Streptomyces sp. NBC_01185]